VARGGKRPGAGRKPGSQAKKTKTARAVADRLAEEDMTPLQVMVTVMRRHIANGDWDKAAAIAKDAAPYMHPRRATLTHEGGESPIEVKLVRDRNFYRNADRLPPRRDGAPGAGAASPGSDEGGGVRAPVGQNGAGLDLRG
jgi:hypothetical protein